MNVRTKTMILLMVNISQIVMSTRKRPAPAAAVGPPAKRLKQEILPKHEKLPDEIIPKHENLQPLRLKPENLPKPLQLKQENPELSEEDFLRLKEGILSELLKENIPVCPDETGHPYFVNARRKKLKYPEEGEVYWIKKELGVVFVERNKKMCKKRLTWNVRMFSGARHCFDKNPKHLISEKWRTILTKPKRYGETVPIKRYVAPNCNGFCGGTRTSVVTLKVARIIRPKVKYCECETCASKALQKEKKRLVYFYLYCAACRKFFHIDCTSSWITTLPSVPVHEN